MFPELQKPRVTEIQVRMDCNGCVQKMKKTLNGINGIYDHYIDFPQQKITVVGWADPERIIKAIKKTRKTATICSPTEPTEFPSQPTESEPEPEPEPEPEGNAPAPDPPQQLSEEAPPAQAATQAEPPPEQPPPEAPTPTENNASLQSQSTPGTKDVGQVHEKYHYPPNYANRFGSGPSYVGHRDRYHLITPGTKDVGQVQVHEKYHYPPNYANRFSSGHSYVGHGDRYHNSPVFLQEPPPPIYVTHSYNSYKPSPYVTEYEYARSPPRHTHHNRMEYYSGDYQNRNGNITSIFSDENPNACRIV